MDGFKEKFANSLDKMLLGVLVTLVGAAGFFWYSESSSIQQNAGEPTERSIEKVISTEPWSESDPSGLTYHVVMEMVGGRGTFEDNKFFVLVEDNPFDAKTVKDSEKLEKEAGEHITEAIKLLDLKDYDGAMKEIDEALKLSRTNTYAKQLKAQITAEKIAAEEKAAAEKAAAAAATEKEGE